MSTLSFAIGDERLDLPAASVREVARLPRLALLPGAAPAVLGVAHLGGVVVAVVSTRVLLDLQPAPPGSDQLVVVLDRRQRRLALVVDRALDAPEAGRRALDPERLLTAIEVAS